MSSKPAVTLTEEQKKEEKKKREQELLEKQKADELKATIKNANLLFANKSYGQALEIYDQVVKDNPNNVEAINNQGLVYKAQQNNTKALERYNAALKIDETCSNAYYNIALIHKEQKNWTEADSNLRLALKHDPKNFWAHYNQGLVLRELNRNTEAIEHFNKALALNDKYAVLFSLELGEANKALGNFKGALESYKDVVSKDETHLKANAERAELQIFFGKNEDAIKSFDKCIAVDKEKNNHYVGKARALINLKKQTEAIDLLDKVLAQDPKNLNALVTKARAYRSLSDATKTQEVLNLIFKTDATNVEGLYLRGQIEFDNQNYEAAKTTFESILSQKKEYFWAQFYVVYIDQTQKKFKEAGEHLEVAYAIQQANKLDHMDDAQFTFTKSTFDQWEKIKVLLGVLNLDTIQTGSQIKKQEDQQAQKQASIPVSLQQVEVKVADQSAANQQQSQPAKQQVQEPTTVSLQQHAESVIQKQAASINSNNNNNNNATNNNNNRDPALTLAESKLESKKQVYLARIQDLLIRKLAWGLIEHKADQQKGELIEKEFSDITTKLDLIFKNSIGNDKWKILEQPGVDQLTIQFFVEDIEHENKKLAQFFQFFYGTLSQHFVLANQLFARNDKDIYNSFASLVFLNDQLTSTIKKGIPIIVDEIPFLHSVPSSVDKVLSQINPTYSQLEESKFQQRLSPFNDIWKLNADGKQDYNTNKFLVQLAQASLLLVHNNREFILKGQQITDAKLLEIQESLRAKLTEEVKKNTVSVSAVDVSVASHAIVSGALLLGYLYDNLPSIQKDKSQLSVLASLNAQLVESIFLHKQIQKQNSQVESIKDGSYVRSTDNGNNSELNQIKPDIRSEECKCAIF